MDKQINHLMAFAERLLLRDDINELTQALEHGVLAECECDADAIAVLSVNFASFVMSLGKSPRELNSITALVGQLVNGIAQNRHRQLMGQCDYVMPSATVH
ncbi:hypothetical protein NL64_06395 [Pseudomonas fluorescens]|uniref:hypothetical protein n=1 Tax=Pseudomonas fluorescens TaxID=294 RepID=UPI00054B8642|nr:hypothetical protein [Pseudomonas fluorescens]KII34885.1 hypothetical protein NL64_06395 [Pseudomonas fluorescens]